MRICEGGNKMMDCEFKENIKIYVRREWPNSSINIEIGAAAGAKFDEAEARRLFEGAVLFMKKKGEA
jgi:hypothetical protein